MSDLESKTQQPVVSTSSGAVAGDARTSTGCVVWLTGLSGAGKTTIARGLESELRGAGYLVCVLDGDCLRRGLCADLGFSPEDRQENIRRVGEVARLFADAGMICLVALISPYRRDRARARAATPGDRFLEVFVNSPIDVCERRDPKGLYARARAGELKEFTGVSAPYEPPLAPEVELRTDLEDIAQCVTRLRRRLEELLAAAAA